MRRKAGRTDPTVSARTGWVAIQRILPAVTVAPITPRERGAAASTEDPDGQMALGMEVARAEKEGAASSTVRGVPRARTIGPMARDTETELVEMTAGDTNAGRGATTAPAMEQAPVGMTAAVTSSDPAGRTVRGTRTASHGMSAAVLTSVLAGMTARGTSTVEAGTSAVGTTGVLPAMTAATARGPGGTMDHAMAEARVGTTGAATSSALGVMRAPATEAGRDRTIAATLRGRAATRIPAIRLLGRARATPVVGQSVMTGPSGGTGPIDASQTIAESSALIEGAPGATAARGRVGDVLTEPAGRTEPSGGIAPRTVEPSGGIAPRTVDPNGENDRSAGDRRAVEAVRGREADPTVSDVRGAQSDG